MGLKLPLTVPPSPFDLWQIFSCPKRKKVGMKTYATTQVAKEPLLVNLVAEARKIVVLSGAGISCSSGIPDFRSADGLYSLLSQKYPKLLVKGSMLFSSELFKEKTTTQLFYSSMSMLHKMCLGATPSTSHYFLTKLRDDRKLLRVYTQNIDGLEERYC